VVYTQEGSIFDLSTKFEVDSSLRSKVIRGPIIWKLGHVTSATPT